MARDSWAPVVAPCRHSCSCILVVAACVAFATISLPAAKPVLAGVQENARSSTSADAAARNAPARESRPSGNPMWAVPLSALSMTRERPLFSPSRRPPPPVVVAIPEPSRVRLPPPPAEPERPLLTLLGTIVGESERVGVFLDQATQSVVRLRPGDAHDAWMLRSVHGREVELEKSSQTAILSLPAPGADPKAQSASPDPSDSEPYAPAQHRKRVTAMSTNDADLR
jgi:hypothetical protein